MRGAPRVARWLLDRVLAAELRDEVVGDLEEIYARRYARSGRMRAAWWYWRAALRLGVRLGWERLSRRRAFGLGSGVSLELKLGGRMLVKYPGLTLIGGLAIAVSIAIASAFFEFAREFAYPELPLPHGDRIVGIQNWDVSASEPERRTLHDFEVWRRELNAIEEVSAFSTVQRNLITADGRVDPVTAAEMTASGFRVAGVAPLLGRTLVDTDEEPGAPLVAVLGHGVWQSRFGGDPDVLGRPIRLGAREAIIVGVMPDGFAFPMNHRLWLPLQADPLAHARREGPSLAVFGLLAPGADIEAAQAELSALGLRAAADYPQSNVNLRPRVLTYVHSLVDDTEEARLMNIPFIMLLLVAYVNVATLVFARTALRESEIVVRSALGATRSRVLLQLYLEALVLSAAGAAVGIIGTSFGLRRALDIFWSVNGGIETRPFWWQDGLSPATFAYAALLATVGALIAGGIPALRATGRQLQARLRNIGSTGGMMSAGRLWTGVIVTQVAITVLLISAQSAELSNWANFARRDDALALRNPAVSSRLAWDVEATPAAAGRQRAPARLRADLVRRIAEQPGVRGVTFATGLPRLRHPLAPVETESPAPQPHWVHVGDIAPDYFDVLGVPLVAGRAFVAADTLAARRVVIVNESFATEILGDPRPLGRRIRFTTRGGGGGPWHEIIGVAPDLVMQGAEPRSGAGLYRPLAAGRTDIRLIVAADDPESFASRLRAIAAGVDPSLRLLEIQPLERAGDADRAAGRLLTLMLSLVVGMALLLSMAGLYALMSLAVTRRTREIGIRLALGAPTRIILREIFGRSLAQLSIGIALGIGGFLAFAEDRSLIPPLLTAALMLAVGIIACLSPARRGLSIEPTEALRDA